jgi:hypothetical protein
MNSASFTKLRGYPFQPKSPAAFPPRDTRQPPTRHCLVSIATLATRLFSCVYYRRSDTRGVKVSILFTHHPEWRRLQSVRFSGNKLGSAGGVSAMDSNSGNRCLSGSGTFTLEPFNMLMSCSALTTPFP